MRVVLFSLLTVFVSFSGCTPVDPEPGCGNTRVEAGEQCDDGNRVDGDGCDADCSPTGCGNAVVTAPEACDDGNGVDGDGCDSNCSLTGCGNGVVTAPEQCDQGGLNANLADTCRPGCVLPACRDGIHDPLAGEGCDDGNAVEGDGCDTNCTATACGNGVVTAFEHCDDGNAVGGDGCEQNCRVTGWISDGRVYPVCATGDGSTLVVSRAGTEGRFEAIRLESGATVEFGAQSVSCISNAVGITNPTVSFLDSAGQHPLEGSTEAWHISSDNQWAMGIGFVDPELQFPFRLREYSLATGSYQEVLSWCHPFGIYLQARAVAAYCPDATRLEVITWAPGALEERTSIPITPLVESEGEPYPLLRYGTQGNRVALHEINGGRLWDVLLDGSGQPPEQISDRPLWAELSPDEEELVYAEFGGTLLRQSRGAAEPVTLATGLWRQASGAGSSVSRDYFRVSPDFRWVAFHKRDPDLQLYLASVRDPTWERPIAVGGLQRGALWKSFTDDGQFLLYQLPEGTYAQPTAGGDPVLVDSTLVEIFTAGDSVIAWTSNVAAHYAGELRVRDLASAEPFRVLGVDVALDTTMGPVKVGRHGLAYLVTRTLPSGGSDDSLYVRDLR